MPGGRPSNIDTVIGTDATGADITIADAIVNALRAGAYFEEAAISSGVTKETAYEWRRVAGRARLRTSTNTTAKLNPHETKCVAFSDAVDQARAQWEIGVLGTLEREGRGGVLLEEELIEYDGVGPGAAVVKRTVRRSNSRPDVRVLLWRLERTMPHKYGRRVEVTGVDGEPLFSDEERTALMVEAFESFKAAAPKRKRTRKTKTAEPTSGSAVSPRPRSRRRGAEASDPAS